MCAGRGGEATSEQQKQQRLVHGLMGALCVRHVCAKLRERVREGRHLAARTVARAGDRGYMGF